jgi:hypothetical protein
MKAQPDCHYNPLSISLSKLKGYIPLSIWSSSRLDLLPRIPCFSRWDEPAMDMERGVWRGWLLIAPFGCDSRALSNWSLMHAGMQLTP